MRAGAVHALVAGAGVIDRDPRRALEPALKHTGRLGQEVLLAGDEKTHDLALGDRHPEVAQMRDDPRYRHLARVILSEHEAPELGAEVADRPVEQGPIDEIFDRPAHPYTQALIASTPKVDRAARRERIVLKGEIPSPLNPPSGCAFHNRCPYASELCAAERPQMRPLAGRLVACHHADTIVD